MDKRLIIFLSSILLLVSQLTAQQQTNEIPEVKVLSRAQTQRILLRWSANTPLSWKLSNEYGYTLLRYTIMRDGKTLPKQEVKDLGTIKPAPLEEWEAVIDANDNGAIIAQALYGDSFQVSGGGKLETMMAVSEDEQQRFSFALFAADQDFEIAVKAGLGYIDMNIRPNEKYLYKVKSNVPVDMQIIKEGAVFVGLSDYKKLPKPVDFSVNFADSNAMLSWNFKLLSATYNSYNIERSLDGVNFKKINDTPYTIMNAKVTNQRSGSIVYMDSVTNNVAYTYRVRGISSFGEQGPPSETKMGTAKEVLKQTPSLIKKKITSSNSVTLFWEFPEAGNHQIKGFELNRSISSSGPYQVVLKEIPPEARSVEFNQLGVADYFTITAVGKQNNKKTSFSMLVQPVDSIPPVVPVGLKTEIDSLGVVKLSWNKNTEKDLLGYRVYMANTSKAEFTPLFADPQTGNIFVDTLNMKTLNSKVYYKVSALDKRYNMSPLSQVIEVIKPDIIPPTAPVFKSYSLTDKRSISLQWTKSSSLDVNRYALYKKVNKDAEWQLVFEGNQEQLSFLDKKIQEGNVYQYTVIAIDESSLESTPSPSVSLAVRRLGVRSKVKSIYATPNREQQRMEISWRYKEKDVAEFEIYRSEEDGPLRLFRMAPAGTKVVYDTNMTINTTYTYKIRAVFKDGNMSETNTIKIKY